MNARCLSAVEVGLLLAHLSERGSVDEEFAEALEAAKDWELCLVCHNLFIARHVVNSTAGLDLIARVYAAEDEMALELQEGGDLFVEYLLRHQRVSSETLDDALVSIQDGLSNYSYEKALRY